MYRLKVRKVGNSLGVTLPANAVRALNVREGGAIYLTESSEGFRIRAFDPKSEAALEAAAGFMARYRNALRTLSN